MKTIRTFLVAVFLCSHAVAQPLLLKDINPGNKDGISTNLHMLNHNGKIYFTAQDADHNMELWSSDGTETGTVKVKEINTLEGSYPHDLFIFNDKLFFGATHDSIGDELYVSDGSSMNTVLFRELYDPISPSAGSVPGPFFEYNGKMYVWGYDIAEDPTQFLWESDGSEVGTNKTGFTNAGNYSTIKQLEFKDKIVFNTFNPATSSSGLVITDITSAGTLMLHDEAHTHAIEKLNESTFLYTSSMGNDVELWASDGTVAGTKKLRTFSQNITHFTVHHNEIYFWNVHDGLHDLWKSDGTMSGTLLVKGFESFDNMVNIINNANRLISLDQHIYFAMPDSNGNSALWISDGTEAGTVPLKYFQNSNQNGFTYLGISLSNAAILNDVLYFSAKDANGWEPWQSDGTDAGTQMIFDIAPGAASSMDSFNNFFSVQGNRVYFAADNGATGTELFYVTNGAPTGVSNSLNKEEEILFYPNPANETLWFNSDDIDKVEIFDMHGRLLMSHTGKTSALNISDLAQGIYCIILNQEPGNKTKLVIY